MTGVANVALIGPLAQLRSEQDITLTKTVHKGVEMGRLSLLSLTAQKQQGVATATYVGSRCVPMMTGTIALA